MSIVNYILLLLAVLCISCEQKTTEKATFTIKGKLSPDMISMYRYSVDLYTNEELYGKKYTFFKDSVFYRREDTLVCNELRQYYYPNGKLYREELYNRESWGLQPLVEYWYNTEGKLSEYIYYFNKKDSIIYDRDTVRCHSLHISYNNNGKIEERTCMGDECNKDVCTGIGVGTRFFYKDGKLVETKYYHNDILGRDYIIHRTYNNRGEYCDIITNNYDLFETDKKILSPQEAKRRLRESSYHCKVKNILSLKNKTLQAELFRKINSTTAEQYAERNRDETVNITPAILNKYLSDIEKDLSTQVADTTTFERTYHYKLVPPEFAKQASNAKNKIYLSFYPKSCDFTLHLLYSYYLKEHDVVVESSVIYYFTIIDGKIANFGRDES